jgi:hypothetical protein
MPTAIQNVLEQVLSNPQTMKQTQSKPSGFEQSTLVRRGVGLRGVDYDAVSPGYTVFAHLTSPGTIRLIANDGTEAHRWNLPYRPGRHARILPNGNLAYNGVHPDAPRLFPLWQKYRGGVMMEIDPVSTFLGECLVRRKIFSEEKLLISQSSRPGMSSRSTVIPWHTMINTTLETEKSCTQLWKNLPRSKQHPFQVEFQIVKLQMVKYTQWKVIDHLDPQVFPLQPHYAREHWPLINSVYPLKDGNILASLRSVSAVIIISRETGEVIWHLDSTVVAQQHCASELDDGTILIFDNGTFRHRESATYSRVIQVERKTKKIVWEYRDPHPMTFFTPFMGGAQRLQNGNTLITEAAFGRVFEVTKEGKMCWEYVNEDFADYKGLDAEEIEGYFDYPANALFRAYKYTPEQIPWLRK